MPIVVLLTVADHAPAASKLAQIPLQLLPHPGGAARHAASGAGFGASRSPASPGIGEFGILACRFRKGGIRLSGFSMPLSRIQR